MPFPVRVEKVVNVSEWDSNYGKMVKYLLEAINVSTGQPVTFELNAKPKNVIRAGDTFEVEDTGQEYQGTPRFKRVQEQRGQAAPRGNGAQPQAQRPTREPVPYAKALAAYRRFAADLSTPEQGTSMFIAWLRGDVADPPAEQGALPIAGPHVEPTDDAPWDLGIEPISKLTSDACLTALTQLETRSKGSGTRLFRMEFGQQRHLKDLTEQEGKRLQAILGEAL